MITVHNCYLCVYYYSKSNSLLMLHCCWSSLPRWLIPVKCPSTSMQCQHFQNHNAHTLLGQRWWHLACVLYGSWEKLLGSGISNFSHVRAPRSYPGRFEPLQKLAAGYTRLALNWPAAWLRVVIPYLYIFHVLFSYLYKPGTSFNPPPAARGASGGGGL